MLQYIPWAANHLPLKSVGGKDLQHLLLGAKQLTGCPPLYTASTWLQSLIHVINQEWKMKCNSGKRYLNKDIEIVFEIFSHISA